MFIIDLPVELNLLSTYQKNRMNPSILQLRATVWGRVQGVGFRVKTRQCALKLDLKGTVSNLEDGNVEIIAQGSRVQLENFLTLLHEHFGSGYIARIDKEFEKPTELFEKFTII